MIVFLLGKGPAAEAILAWLCGHGFRVFVFSHEGQEILESARRLGVWSTVNTVNDVDKWPVKPGVIASVGYLTIIKPKVLQLMQGRVFNGHAALLPHHRGRSSVPWAILDGDQMTGCTYHWMTEGIDEGRILVQGACEIDEDETQATLWVKVNSLLVSFFPAALRLALLDLPGVEQESGGQYHYAGPPYNGAIDPRWDNEYVGRFIRAMDYPPLPPAHYNGRKVRTLDEYLELRKAERDLEPIF